MNTDRWASFVEDFRQDFPELYENVVGWYPTGGKWSIVLYTKEGTRYIYSWMRPHQVKIVEEPRKSLYEENRKELAEEFGEALRWAMDEAFVTQKTLAARTGIPQSTLSRYINGQKIPNVIIAMKIADALNCTVYDLTCHSERW